MILRELAAKLGLDFDAQSFLKAETAFNFIKEAGEKLKEALDLVAEGFEKAIVGTAEQAHHLELLSQEVGVGTDKLQEYAFAGSLTGLTLDDMALSLGKLSRTVKAAGEGHEEQARALYLAGANAFDASGHMKSLDDILENVAQRFSQMKDGGQKTALAMELFGRSGKQLIPLLNKGKAGIGALREEAHALGVVMSEEDVQAGAELSGEIIRLKSFADGLFRTFGGPLIRALTPLVKKFLDWARANREIIKTRIEQLAKGLISILRVLGRAVLFMVDNWKFLAIAIGAVAAVIYTAFLPAIVGAAAGATFAALSTIAAWTAAAAPFLVIAAVLTLIGLIAEDVYQYLNGGKSVLGEIGPLWTEFLDQFLKVGDGDPWWLVILKRGGQLLTDIFNVDAWRQAIVDIETVFAEFVGWLVQEGTRGGQKLLSALTGGLISGPQSLPETLGQLTRNVVGAQAGAAFNPSAPVASFFGSGGTPAATAAASPGGAGAVFSPNVSATFNVATQPGQSPEAFGKSLRSEWDGWLEEKLTSAAAATQ